MAQMYGLVYDKLWKWVQMFGKPFLRHVSFNVSEMLNNYNLYTFLNMKWTYSLIYVAHTYPIGCVIANSPFWVIGHRSKCYRNNVDFNFRNVPYSRVVMLVNKSLNILAINPTYYSSYNLIALHRYQVAISQHTNHFVTLAPPNPRTIPCRIAYSWQTNEMHSRRPNAMLSHSRKVPYEFFPYCQPAQCSDITGPNHWLF